MQNTRLIRRLAIALACVATLPLLNADEMNDLITTVMQASPEVRTKAQSSHSSSRKSSPVSASSVGKKTTSEINMQIPDSESLEVSSRFPRNYIGKYVYGPVTAGCGGDIFGGNPALIGFWAKNMRCFYLETMDQGIIQKLNKYPYGTKFIIPRECPLKIVQKCGFNYILHLPFETPSTASQ